MRTIEGDPDFGQLESRLVALIRDVQEGDPRGPFAPVAIVAPTRRLLTHLQMTLAGRTPAFLGVRFLHHHALAREAAAAAGAVLPRPLSNRVQESILGRAVQERGGDLAEYAARRPGAVAALLGTMQDLREAGIDAESDLPRGLSAEGRTLFRLYRAYAARLDRLGASGLADRAGLLRAARPHVAAYCQRFRLLIHYGAYDLIGVNLELMREAEASAPVVWLVPHHAESPAFTHARRFWPAFLGDPPAPAPRGTSDRLLGDRLTDLYDEGRRPTPLPDGTVAFFQAQGADAELREAALRLLALHRDQSIPLTRMAIIARSLRPYAPHLEPILAEHGLPFVSTATVEAVRGPRVQATLHLARTVLGDYQRRPLLHLCRSGLWRRDGADPAREAHGWDRLMREAGATRGLRTWTHDMPAWAAAWEPQRSGGGEMEATGVAALKEAWIRRARALAAAVEELRRAAAPLRAAASWSAWADGMERLRERILAPLSGAEPAGTAAAEEQIVGQVLAEMRDLDAVGLPCEGGAARAFFERALAESELPAAAAPVVAASGEPGGVAILDAMQARGLGFDAVVLIGFNADLLPRHPHEDPFLGDDDRALLRQALRAPLPVKAEARDEEHLLLAHLLGAARRHLCVGWQRADESGRARVASLALREVGRLTLGAADQGRVEQAAHRVPTHPLQAAQDWADRHRLLPPRQASLAAALESGGPDRLLCRMADLPRPPGPDEDGVLAAGLAMLQVVEEEGADLRFDADVGAAVPPPDLWSPSRLENLGACPQHYFFRHLLRVEELSEPEEGHAIDPLDLGRVVHGVLHQVYEGLLLEGPPSPGGTAGARVGGDATDPADRRGGSRAGGLEERAAALLDQAWRRQTAPLAARMGARHPLLWEVTAALWLEALRRFLRDDLGRLAAGGARIEGLEEECAARLDLVRRDAPLSIHGRFDRRVRLPDGSQLVADYKSGGTPARHVDKAALLKGTRLQMPLYVLMAEADRAGAAGPGEVRAEVLGVGPAFDAEEARAELDPEFLVTYRQGFLETLGVLADLAAAGHYPLNRDSRLCRVCPYTRACRRTHLPTLRRLERAPQGSDYALLRRKSTRAPTLAAARSRAAAEED
jgi:ATP-dependent helicase/nuclease subunit B